MINKIICALLGHKQVYEAFTGRVVGQELMESMTHYKAGYGENIFQPIYKWERSDFCLRCGKKLD